MPYDASWQTFEKQKENCNLASCEPMLALNMPFNYQNVKCMHPDKWFKFHVIKDDH